MLLLAMGLVFSLLTGGTGQAMAVQGPLTGCHAAHIKASPERINHRTSPSLPDCCTDAGLCRMIGCATAILSPEEPATAPEIAASPFITIDLPGLAGRRVPPPVGPPRTFPV